MWKRAATRKFDRRLLLCGVREFPPLPRAPFQLPLPPLILSRPPPAVNAASARANPQQTPIAKSGTCECLVFVSFLHCHLFTAVKRLRRKS